MAYLHSENITGKTFDLSETDGVFELIQSNNSSESGYDNITSIANWHYAIIDPEFDNIYNNANYGVRSKEKLGKDYKWGRDEIKEIVISKYNTHSDYQGQASTPPSHVVNQLWEVIATATGDFIGQEGKIAKSDGANWTFHDKEEIGFETLTFPEKVICVEHSIGTHTQQVSTLGLPNVKALGELYAIRTYLSRQARFSSARSQVYNELFPYKEIVLSDIKGDDLDSTFFDGIEGTKYGDPEGIADYIMGESGTSFSVTGLKHKGWIPESMTLDALCDLIINILINGNY
jgi:hypothetical protein